MPANDNLLIDDAIKHLNKVLEAQKESADTTDLINNYFKDAKGPDGKFDKLKFDFIMLRKAKKLSSEIEIYKKPLSKEEVESLLKDEVDNVTIDELPAVLSSVVYCSPTIRKERFPTIGPAKLVTEPIGSTEMNNEGNCAYIVETNGQKCVYWAIQGTDVSTYYTLVHDVVNCYRIFIGRLTDSDRWESTQKFGKFLFETYKGYEFVVTGHSLGGRLAFEVYKRNADKFKDAFLYSIGTGVPNVFDNDDEFSAGGNLKQPKVFRAKYDLVAVLAQFEFPESSITTIETGLGFPANHAVKHFIRPEINEAIDDRLVGTRGETADWKLKNQIEEAKRLAPPRLDTDRKICAKLIELEETSREKVVVDKVNNKDVVFFVSKNLAGGDVVVKGEMNLTQADCNPKMMELYKSLMNEDNVKAALTKIKKNFVLTGFCTAGTMARFASRFQFSGSEGVEVVTFAELIADTWETGLEQGRYRHYYSTFDPWAQMSFMFTFDKKRTNIKIDAINYSNAGFITLMSYSQLKQFWDLWAAKGTLFNLGLAKFAFDFAKVTKESFLSFHTLGYINENLQKDERVLTTAQKSLMWEEAKSYLFSNITD